MRRLLPHRHGALHAIGRRTSSRSNSALRRRLSKISTTRQQRQRRPQSLPAAISRSETQLLGRERGAIRAPQEQHGRRGQCRKEHEDQQTDEAVDQHAGRGVGGAARVNGHGIAAYDVAADLAGQKAVEELGLPLVREQPARRHGDAHGAQQHAPLDAAHGHRRGSSRACPAAAAPCRREVICAHRSRRVLQAREEKDNQRDADGELEKIDEALSGHGCGVRGTRGTVTGYMGQSDWIRARTSKAVTREYFHPSMVPPIRYTAFRRLRSVWVWVAPQNDVSRCHGWWSRTPCTFCFCVQAMSHTTWRSRLMAKSYQPMRRL